MKRNKLQLTLPLPGRLLISAATMVLLAATPANAQPNSQDASSASILQGKIPSQVHAVQENLELLRVYMGKPRNRQADLKVSNVSLREVHGQVEVSYGNAERLCFEHTREHGEKHVGDATDPTPEDVEVLLDRTLERLERVACELGVECVPVRPGATLAEMNLADLFFTVVSLNRQLNLMLEVQTAPSDVFQKVTSGIGYTSKLLGQFPDAVTIPNEPPFEPGKRPCDVYRRLLHCFEDVRRIAERSGLQVLDIHLDDTDIDNAAPSDVYHLASLIVSELAYIHGHVAGAEQPPEVFYVGRKFPSDVYQRGGILEQQLQELKARVDANPNWMTPN